MNMHDYPPPPSNSSANTSAQFINKPTTKRPKKPQTSTSAVRNPQPTPTPSSSSRKRPFDSISHHPEDPSIIDQSHQHNPSHPHHHHHHHHHHPTQQQPVNNNQLNHHHHHHHRHHAHPQQAQQPQTNHNSLPPIEEDFPMIRCGWNDCRQGFWILEDLINHLTGENGHVPPDPTAPRGQKCPCEWTGCPKQGKPQGSRMALMVHLRSHTGEKPFSCHRPECDKTFSRTDALAKHVRVSHGEIMHPSRPTTTNNNNNNSNLKAPLNSNNGVNTTNKRTKGENESEEEENEEINVIGGSDRTQHNKGNKRAEKEFIEVINDKGKCFNDHIDADLRTEEERKCLEDLKVRLPSNDFAFLELLVLKAKIKFALGEREIMKSELNFLKNKEENLHRQKDSLLDEIMKHKIGMESSSLWRSSTDNNNDNNNIDNQNDNNA